MSNDDVTPIRQQYLDIKRDYPNTILFFRLGDFYETFDEDAEITARELDIVLTSRTVGKGMRVPLAGIPYHAVENYLARMIERGYHVAICEQVGDQPTKGIFPRKVVRIVTPGTVIEPGLLPGDANNYLVAVVLDEKAAAVSYADISTGEFAVTELPSEALRAELTRLHPAEIIHPDNQALTALPEADGLGHLTGYPAWRFETGKCEETLLTHFKAAALDGFGLKGHQLAVRAAGAVLQYIKDTQPDSLRQLNSLRVYSLNEFMTLDAPTRRNLELDETLRGERKGSLLGTLDHTVTPMGKRLVHQWVSQPLLNVGRIKARQDGVQFFFERGMVRAELRAALRPLADLERLVNRIIAGIAQPRDLVALRETLGCIPAIQTILTEAKSRGKLDPCVEEFELLTAAIANDPPATLQNTGIIRPGHSQELDAVIEASRHARDWIANLEAVERERTGIKTLKVGYNKVFGYYIEISRGAADKAPEHYIRKQTLVNAERFITPEMKEYETLVLNAEERIREIELRLFKEVCATLARSAARLLSTAKNLAKLDVLLGLAEAAALGGYSRPEIHDGRELEIYEGRHPVVEQSLHGKRYVPNDVVFEQGEIVRVITGPNMSGKCVTADTLIWTERGLQPIGALKPDHSPVDEFTPVSILVEAKDGRRPATHFYNGGTQKTVRVRTRLGFEIEGTHEHPLWVRTADGVECWQPLARVGKGDAAILRAGTNTWGNETEINFPRPEQRMALQADRFPQRLNPELAYVVGLLVGDGTLSDTHGIYLPAPDESTAGMFKRVMAEQFSCTVQVGPENRGLTVKSTQIRLFFEALGLHYADARHQSVPESILAAPRETITAFLQGLFDIRGGADQKTGDVTLSTCAPRLAKQVHAILLNHGIVGCLSAERIGEGSEYRIDISGEDVVRFHLRIGLRLRGTRARPDPGRARELSATAGILLLEDARNSGLQQAVPTSGGTSAVNAVTAAQLGEGSEDRYIYDPIVGIESTPEAEVFDLTVPDGHAFIANGFISHNSTYLRQTALTVLMAQMGSFVPADSAKIGLVDRIFTRIGAQDEIHAGQSTFMVEMIEAANILHHATPRSLLILDEIGRGTSTYDGVSIAWAVVEYIHNHPQLRAKTLFATHYHELTQLADLLPGVRNYNVAVTEADSKVVFLHKIVPGGADRSYGIHVAQLAGLPGTVIQRANEIMEELEKTSGRAVRIDPHTAQQVALFPETNPLLDEISQMDVNSISPIEALNKLFEWKRRFTKS